MKKYILFIVIAFLLIPASAFAEETEGSPSPSASDISNSEVLHRCISEAIEKHPELREMRARLVQSYAQLGQTRSSFYPQIDFSSSYGASATQTHPDSISDYSHSFSLRQYITDFGRTSSLVKASYHNYAASMCELKSLEDDIIYSVKSSYYSCLAAKQLIAVNQESVEAYSNHLEQAKAFFETGQKSKIEVTTAEVDLTNADYALIKAKNSYDLAYVTLLNAIGVIDDPLIEFADSNEYILPQITYTIDELLTMAKDQRPDVLKSDASLQAAKASFTAAAAEFAPSISGSAGYGWSGEHYPLDHSWRVGLSLSLMITDGNATAFKVKEAKARVDEAEASDERVWQNVVLEIRTAYITMLNAAENIEVTAKAVQQADENFYLAQSRYNVGVGSNLEFIDAQVSLLEAKISRISAMMDYYIAVAQLEKAVGAELTEKNKSNMANPSRTLDAQTEESTPPAPENTDSGVVTDETAK